MLKTINESNIKLTIQGDHPSPKASIPYFNPKMKLNRELILLTLTTMAEYKSDIIECFDGFGATGVMSLQWKFHLRNKIRVLVCDLNAESCKAIKENAAINNISLEEISLNDLKDTFPVEPNDTVQMLHSNCNLVMLKKSFDFIHLDPFGTTVQFLETAFANLRHGGIITITSTDVASLIARNPQVVLRNYSAHVLKTSYPKEIAVRIIIASAVRCAAKCNKGLNVLFTMASDTFILVAFQVVRGINHIEQCLSNIKRLLHCRICEERVFLPADEMAPIINPYSHLPCHCKEENPGITAAILGPMWSADIFNSVFLDGMIEQYESKKVVIPSNELSVILNLMKAESSCSSTKSSNHMTTQCFSSRPSLIITDRMPTFYYSPTRLKLTKSSIPSMSELERILIESGYCFSRTHFDRTALRTNATRQQLRDLILKSVSNN